MIRSLLVQGLTILVQVIVVVAGTYGIKYLRKVQASIEAKIGKDNYENAKSFAKTMVYSIEQQYPDLAGNERFTKVIEAVNKKFGSKLTDEEITNLIEAGVKEMNIVSGKGKTIAAETAIIKDPVEIPNDAPQNTDVPKPTSAEDTAGTAQVTPPQTPIAQ